MTSLPENIPFTINTSDPTVSISSCDRMVIGQLGQTLDGCIAIPTGDSKYINSDCRLRHLHRIRSAVEAVIVGVGCVNADNPKLSVRLCSGNDPVRVIIDSRGRVDLQSCLFNDGVSDVILITSQEVEHPALGKAEIIKLPAHNHHISPSEIVKALFARGFEKILVEGGNQTLSNFMDAGVLDKLHLIVAPVIMGGGLSGLNLMPIDKLHEALRPEITLYPLGRDILFDCNFSKA